MRARARGVAPLPQASPTLAALGVGVRRAREADTVFLRDLHHALRAPELALLDWPAAAKTRFLDDQFRLQCAHFAGHHPEGDFLIVTRSAPPLAAADIGRLYVDRGPERWHLLEITLAAAHRNAGIGSALIRWLQHGAKAAGARTLSLQVAFANRAAAALYERLGLSEVDRSATHRVLACSVS